MLVYTQGLLINASWHLPVQAVATFDQTAVPYSTPPCRQTSGQSACVGTASAAAAVPTRPLLRCLLYVGLARASCQQLLLIHHGISGLQATPAKKEIPAHGNSKFSTYNAPRAPDNTRGRRCSKISCNIAHSNNLLNCSSQQRCSTGLLVICRTAGNIQPVITSGNTPQ